MNDKHIEQKLEQLADAVGSRNSFVNDVMSRIENCPVQPGKKQSRNVVFRSIIMKNTLKFTSAAVIFIAAGLFMYFQNIPFDGVAKVYGMTDVPTLFHSAKTLHIKGKVYFPEYQVEEPVETEYWVDIENSRWRSIKPSYLYSAKNGFEYDLTEQVFDGLHTKVFIDHQEKEMTYYTVSELQKNLSIQRSIGTLLQLTCGEQKVFDTYKIQRQDTIDGCTYNLWEGRVNIGSMKIKLHSWLCPQTGKMAKADVWGSKDGQEWFKKYQFDTVEMNVPIDESIFNLTGPTDYQATNSIETATLQPLGKMVGGLSVVNLEEYFLFALPNNCLIMCWRNELNNNEQTENQYFDQLYFGGPLPQLPAEVFALKTEIDENEYLWQGKHLTSTHKNGKFYEWAIYIPEKTPPIKPNHMYNFTLVYRMNIDQNANVTLGTGPDITIENQADFEKLVIEGIRMLSDDQTLPTPFTLEEVLSLASEQ